MSLNEAIRQGDLYIAQVLIEEGADVNKDQGGFTPLHIAVRESNLRAIQFLLDHGADVNVRGIHRSIPLHFAACEEVQNSFGITKLLLENGADCNDRDFGVATPFLCALSCQSLKIIQFFLEHGADMTAVCSEGWNALCYATKNSHLEVIEFILDQRFDVNFRNAINDSSVLEYAAKYGSADACELLINRGAMVNSKNLVNNNTPLSAAVTSKRKDARVVQMLLEHGASVNEKVGDLSILALARWKNRNQSVMKLLIRQMAKLEYMNLEIHDEDRLLLIELSDGPRKYYKQCVEELDQMNLTKFYHNVSISSIFAKRRKIIAGYARNQDLVKALEEKDYESQFPIYFGWLKKNFNAEVLKQRLRTEAAKNLSYLFKFNDSLHPVNRKIISFVNDEELRFLLET